MSDATLRDERVDPPDERGAVRVVLAFYDADGNAAAEHEAVEVSASYFNAAGELVFCAQGMTRQP